MRTPFIPCAHRSPSLSWCNLRFHLPATFVFAFILLPFSRFLCLPHAYDTGPMPCKSIIPAFPFSRAIIPCSFSLLLRLSVHLIYYITSPPSVTTSSQVSFYTGSSSMGGAQDRYTNDASTDSILLKLLYTGGVCSHISSYANTPGREDR